MPVINELREDIREYIKKRGLMRKWHKARSLFENNPSHPSLNTELLEPRHRDCVAMVESAINPVMPAKAGIQNLLKILDSVSRFACTE